MNENVIYWDETENENRTSRQLHTENMVPTVV